MSLNHLEFDKAIQELRDERPDALRRARILDALLKPRRMSLKAPGLAAAAAMIVAIFFLVIPTRGSALAWAEVLRRTQLAANMHITYLNDKGQVTGENWRSGTMWAVWIKDKSGRVTCETRSDHSTFYSYLYRVYLNSPNATQYATVWNKTPQMLEGEKRFGGPIQTIDALLKSRTAKLLSQGKAEVDGMAVQRFEVDLYHEPETVDADPSTGRILYVHLKGGETERFEYPESIDPNTFSFDARRTRGVYLLDRRGHDDPKKEPPYMPKTIAAKGGIQLREVSVGVDGDLWVRWTGYLPSGRAVNRLRVIGVKTGVAHFIGYFKDGIHPVQGPPSKRLIGYRVALPEKIGDRVTIRIPTPSSYAEFKDVPVAKLHPLNG